MTTLAAATLWVLAILGDALHSPYDLWLTGTVALLWSAMACYAWLRYYTWSGKPRHRRDDR